MSLNRLVKLKAMSAAEIAHRLAYRAYTAIERSRHQRGSLSPPDRFRHALRPDIAGRDDWSEVVTAERTAGKFFGWEKDADAVRTVFHEQFTKELTKARDMADAAARHEVSFFGATFQLGTDINWHADPVSGTEWPRRYHRDVPVHGGNVGYGDVKYVWEVNRHQFFVDIAKSAFLDRSSRHADALHSMLRSWHASVSYGTGVPWACALEPAFRAYSWLWAYHLVRAAGMLDRDTHLLWLRGLYDHGRFLHRHLERYSSPYNHLIGEAATLFAIGLSLPEVGEAESWVERGRSVLNTTVAQQFHSDGGTVEQSTFYHHATLGFYLLSIILGRRTGVELSRDVTDAVCRALEFSIALMQPDGLVPRIGGADDGKPIRLEHLPLWDFRPYYAVGAVLFSRADFKFAAGRFWEDALWLLGVDGLRAFDRLASTEPPLTAPLKASGYYVARSGWSPVADYVCFDCGEQAAGLRRDGIPSAAHGHADCLSVIVGLAGQEVLVDPGFFCYNGDSDWEVHFRKTGAHNTVKIDARDQAQHVSKMAWTHTYTARPEGWSDEQAIAWVRGSHDGYARHQNGVTHRRTVWLRDEGYVAILDEILGDSTHAAHANFQFAPGTLECDGESAVLYNRQFELAWLCTAAVKSSIASGHAGPGGGWVARSLGVREPAPRIALEFRCDGPRTALLTILADRKRGAGIGRRVGMALHGPALFASVRGGSGEDWLIAGAAAGGSLPIETDGALAAVRFSGGAVVATSRIDGSYVRVPAGVGRQLQIVSGGRRS